MADIDLAYQGSLWYLEILSSTDPDMQPACYLFNVFFSIQIFFGIIGLLIQWIVRTLSRT